MIPPRTLPLCAFAILPPLFSVARPAVPGWIAEFQKPSSEKLRRKARIPPDLLKIRGKKIESPAEWRKKRRFVLARWRAFLGELPKPERLSSKIEEKVTLPGGIRRTLLALEVEENIWMPCYLFRPPGKGPFPGCICLHSTTDETIRQPAGLGAQPEKAFALDLAKRGYVTIAPENFLWYWPLPEEEKRKGSRYLLRTRAFMKKHPGVKGMEKMIFDASLAVDYLAGLPEVRKDAIGAIGHSLGGKEVTFLMAFDRRIACGVSSEGGVAFHFSNYDSPWYLGPEIRKERRGLHPTEILVLIAPRAWLLVGGDSADGEKSRPYVEAVLPLWRLLGKPDGAGLMVHGKGHAVPPEAREAAFRWLDYHLRGRK